MSATNRTYRIYCFDSAHAILTADWIDAGTDEEAITKAKARGFGTKCEVWERSRLVASLEQPRIPPCADLNSSACAQSA